ncbi:cytosolic 4-alpha-glucanotransferase [Volvox carteri f. nagariensis]|uniref:4-alpha-glucanotransferase n=1 Tax=Volvox carteri f. nagariensis TaxID=3068 RepID=D8UDU0_VOLCA|nr:cytosolic 4-alpha-glucanotransferase [Volvox carteri f. nagariensis]EFJ42152.1 cytosolic 4-alpha-glucanotransferase [Volvox carteri f. nagariensis]|eukprot:XP_002956849.1 cytosolic 4-alpha-glucanotransferase [Volvox carteri f. nagariensis]
MVIDCLNWKSKEPTVTCLPPENPWKLLELRRKLINACQPNLLQELSDEMASGAREPWQQASVTLHFSVSYPTQWGQSILLSGSGALLGSLQWSQARQMSCHHEKDVLVWEATILLPWKPYYTYKYALARQKDDEVAPGANVHGNWVIEKEDAAGERTVWLPEGLQGGDLVEVCDTWVDKAHPAALMASAAFTKVLFAHKPQIRNGHMTSLALVAPAPGETVLRLAVADFQLDAAEVLLVTGGISQLGNWQPDQMLRLTETHTPFWEAELRVPYSCFPFTYKYAIQTADGLVLEVGEPRLASLPSSASVGAPTVMVRHDGYFRRDRHWRGAGVAVPVFSLRTNESVGVGEFLDLIPLVDLADKCGLRMIQVLPVNDTCVYGTWWDSYPYSTLSVHALHPQYLALRELLAEEGQQLPHDLAAELHKARRDLDGPEVDYEATLAFKNAFVKKVYDRYGKGTLQSSGFQTWFAANSYWLRPYAAFCFLRDIFQTSEHWRWGCMSAGTEEVVERLTRPGGEFYGRILMTYYVQYHLHRQLLRASEYAASRRVVLKGDLPIGVDKRSVDCWTFPRLFRMDKSTGAPPDAFSPTGQNWGFPTYNWEVMAADGYDWWRSRLRHLAQYFTAYRIDHVLGFFRIWEVPGDCVTGLLGYFRPSRPLTRSELEQRGVWDIDRLTRPYITEALVRQLFGAERAEVVSATYMLEDGKGKYRLRPAYSSEAAIAAIPLREDSPDWLVREVEETRAGLIKLRQNVVLLPDPEDPDAFHPRRQEDVWRSSALSKLPALQAASDMLVCGEDLGFVPACVPPVMKELGLIGLRIQRMATEPGKEFNNPGTYTYLTVASPSCHDVTPLRAWYESDPDRAERFYYHQLGGCGPPPPVCTPDVVRAVLQQHINCGSMLAVFPIQDLTALSLQYTTRPASAEVINDPTVSKHYWRFRIHVTLETLLADSDWLSTIAEMLVLGERAPPSALLVAAPPPPPPPTGIGTRMTRPICTTIML